jgi:hypothetical protein
VRPKMYAVVVNLSPCTRDAGSIIETAPNAGAHFRCAGTAVVRLTP